MKESTSQKASFNTTDGRFTGDIVKINSKTIWVRYKQGKMPSLVTIKRHMRKHNVKILY